MRPGTILVLAVIILVSSGAAHAQWFESLPQSIQDSILWSADHEEGTMNDWTLEQFEYPGGGIFNTGGDEVFTNAATDFAHSGNYSALTRITNAIQAQNGSRAVRLMRWTDTAWDNGGQHIPTTAYYSTWMYFPTTYNPNKYQPWDPGDGGWWNVFQFKARDAEDMSQPMFTLNIDHDDSTQQMHFYLYSGYNQPASNGQAIPRPIPVGEWVHVEARYVVSSTNTGSITIWQDGIEILDVANVRTALIPDSEHATWGIGNYTDHIAGENVDGTATIFFDDAAISLLPLRPVNVLADIDGDGATDLEDNCRVIANPEQIDADGDQYGNACDADFNNDCATNVIDLGILRAAFFTSDPVVDINADGTVNVVDLGLLRGLFFAPPGPSGLTDVCP